MKLAALCLLSLVPFGPAAAEPLENFNNRLFLEVMVDGERAAILDLGEVSARLIGRPVDMLLGRELFDLGNGSEVLIGRAYATRIGLAAAERIVERRAGSGVGGARQRDIVTLRTLDVAGRTFENVRAAIDPGETASDLNIGTPILRHFVMTTDFAGRAIWLEPRE